MNRNPLDKKMPAELINRNRGGNQLGFSILEVLIAIVIVAIGLLSVSMMQVHAIRGNRLARMSTQATFLAQQIVEGIKAGNMVDDSVFGFMDMEKFDKGTVLDEGVLLRRHQNGSPGGPFSVQWKVFSNTKWSRRIGVDISWYGGDRARYVRMTSLSRGDGN